MDNLDPKGAASDETLYKVSHLLHPLVSPFDDSEENLRRQMLLNPLFVSRVKAITAMLINNYRQDYDREYYENLRAAGALALESKSGSGFPFPKIALDDDAVEKFKASAIKSKRLLYTGINHEADPK